MGAKNTSLLAQTVIENIEHPCKFVGCEARMPLARVEDHRKSCGHRLVACPAIQCKAKVAYNELLSHMEKTCQYTSTFHVNTESMEMSTDRFTMDDNIFFLVQNLKARKFKNIYMQMLGSEEECKKYKISIEMKDENKSSTPARSTWTRRRRKSRAC
jgi:hypothetical protein